MQKKKAEDQKGLCDVAPPNMVSIHILFERAGPASSIVSR